MKTIHEYLLDRFNASPQTIYLPKEAEVVGVCGTTDYIKLVVIITPNIFENTLRTFKICATLETIYTNNFKYIGSIQTEFGTQHVIEII